MNKKFVSALAVTGLLISLVPVLAAKPDFQPVNVNKASKPVNITIPSTAVEVAPDIFSLGTSLGVHGEVLEGYAIIHRRGGKAKPEGTPGKGNGGGSTTSTCFAFLANG